MTRMASMPRIAIPPIQRNVTLWKYRQSRPAGCSSTPDRLSGMLTRPCIRSNSFNSCCSWTARAVGSACGDCCAAAGMNDAIIRKKAAAPVTKRRYLAKDTMSVLPRMSFSCALAQPLQPSESRSDRLPVGCLPAPCAGAVTPLGHPFLVDQGNDFAVARQKRFGRTHLGALRQFSFGETIGAVLFIFLLAAFGFRAAGAERAFVHLTARSEVADLRVLRRAKGTSIETIAAANAEILGMQHNGIGRGVEAVYRADSCARSIGAVHAGHRDRPLARLAIINGDDAATIDAPWHLMLVLACGDAGIALDAAVGVAEEFHPCHGCCSLCRDDLTESDFRLLHARRGFVAVARDRIGALTELNRIGALRIIAAQIMSFEPAAEVEWHPGDALADTFGHKRLHLGFRAVLRAGHPDPAAILDAAVGGICRADLDEHVLLQFSEPWVGTRFFATALVFDEPA